eukprot:gb/GECH01003122.1/.p1 GENE.gb/GECH01003122.1/~~gb/GECH01003122.1/.p1  ORF type:complete len:1639 (+),score=343.87 gb/GECH01003122.1/:1-4917(+)
MGGASTKEQEVLQKLKDLQRDSQGWRTVLKEILQTFQSVDHIEYKIDVKNLDLLYDLMQKKNVEEEDQENIFKVMTILLTNSKVYKYLSSSPLLDTLIEEVSRCGTGVRVAAIDMLHRMIHQDTEKNKTEPELEMKKRFTEKGTEIIQQLVNQSEQSAEYQALLSIYISFFDEKRSTSSPQLLENMIQLFLQEMYPIFQLTHHKDKIIWSKAIYTVLLIILEGERNSLYQIQEFARDHGYLLIIALRVLEDEDFDAMWLLAFLCEGNDDNMLTAKRIFGSSLLRHLRQGEINPESRYSVEEFSKKLKSKETTRHESKTIRKSCTLGKWNLLFEKLFESEKTPWNVWNEDAKNQTIEALKEELRLYEERIQRTHDHRGTKWSLHDFYFELPLLDEYHKISGIYIEILLEQLESGKKIDIRNPQSLVSDLIQECTIASNEDYASKILLLLLNLGSSFQNVLGDSEQMKSVTFLFERIWDKCEPLLNLCYFVDLLFRNSPLNRFGFLFYEGLQRLSIQLERIHLVSDFRNRVRLGGIILKLMQTMSSFPKTRRILANEKYFRPLVQASVIKNSEIIDQTLDVVSSILFENPDMEPTLFRTGIFHFVLLELPETCTKSISNFLRKYSKTQKGFELKQLLPPPLISKLYAENGIDEFHESMLEDVKKPDLFWRKPEKETLENQLNSYLQTFLQRLAEDPKTTFEYQSMEPIEYESLKEEICISNIYIEAFLESPDYAIVDPEEVLLSVADETKQKSEPENKSLLLNAQKELFLRNYDKSEFQKYKSFSELNNVLKSDNIEPLSSCISLLSVICTENEKSDQNRQSWIDSCGVQSLFEVFCRDIENHILEESCFTTVVQLICSLCKESTAIEHIIDIKSFFIQIFNFVDKNWKKDEQNAEELLELSHFHIKTSLWNSMHESGYIHFLIKIFIHSVRAECDNIINLTSKSLSEIISIDEAFEILEKILTPGLCEKLKEPEEFRKSFTNDIENPLLIWNNTTREELEKFVCESVEHVVQNGFVKDFKFDYECLSPELLAKDLYVRVFNENPEFQVPNPELYISAICNDLRCRTEKGFEEVNSEMIIMEVTALHNFMVNHNMITLIIQQELSSNMFYNLVLKAYLETNINILRSSINMLKEISRDPVESKNMQSLLNILHCMLYYDSFNDIFFEASDVILRCCEQHKSICKHSSNTGLILTAFMRFALLESGESKYTISSILRVLNQKDNVSNAIMSRLLPTKLVEYLEDEQNSSKSFASFYEEDHYTPLLVWDNTTRKEVIDCCQSECDKIISQLETQLNAKMAISWSPAEILSWESPFLTQKLQISGIYIDEFNENPFFKPENPKQFAQALFEEFESIFEEIRYDNDPSKLNTTDLNNLEKIIESYNNLLDNTPSLYTIALKKLSNLLQALCKHQEKIGSGIMQVLEKIMQEKSTTETLVEQHLLPKLLHVLRNDQFSKEVLGIMDQMISGRPTTVEEFRDSGGILYILELIASSTVEEHVQVKAAQLLCKLTSCEDSNTTQNYVLMFLTPKFTRKLHAKPKKFLEFFKQDHDSNERTWDNETRRKLEEFLHYQVSKLDEDFDEDWDGTPKFDLQELSNIFPDVNLRINKTEDEETGTQEESLSSIQERSNEKSTNSIDANDETG